MAKRDDILNSFLEHELLKRKYGLKEGDLPSTVREGARSPKAIVGAIALIVEGLESAQPPTDNTLRNSILQYLNEKAI